MTLGKSLRDRAGGLEPRAAVRLGLSALIPFALLACNATKPDDGEFSYRGQGLDLWLVTDNRTGCEYLYSVRGGFINRADPHGRVTPNCPEKGGKYGTILPGDIDYSKPGMGPAIPLPPEAK